MDWALVKLIVALLLFNSIVLAGFLSGDPLRSPAKQWYVQAYRLKYRIAPLDPSADKVKLASLHLTARTTPVAECVACHGSMLDSRIAIHRIHLRNELIPGLSCTDCHRRVDLRPRGNVAVVSWVDVGYCKKCHSRFSGLEPASAMKPADFDVDCTTCHSGENAFRHEPAYLSQIIAPAECKGCHGGRVLPWDALHESPRWLTLHGPEALLKGTDSCFKCHDFGLKFCDTCHAIKPPSHKPADAWKATHRDAARKDTRACYTCHKTDFCKECHVNHESGWLTTHPTFVQAKSSKSCERCHSTSFCSSCHARSAAGSGATTAAP
jgi:uncharacterized protein YlaI